MHKSQCTAEWILTSVTTGVLFILELPVMQESHWMYEDYKIILRNGKSRQLLAVEILAVKEGDLPVKIGFLQPLLS